MSVAQRIEAAKAEVRPSSALDKWQRRWTPSDDGQPPPRAAGCVAAKSARIPLPPHLTNATSRAFEEGGKRAHDDVVVAGDDAVLGPLESIGAPCVG